MGQTVAKATGATGFHQQRGAPQASSYSFAPNELAALRRFFAKISGGAKECNDDSAFVNALNLPTHLHKFCTLFYKGCCGIDGDHTSTLNEDKFLRSIETVTKPPLSQQFRFLFGCYAQSAERGAEIDKATINALFLDAALLFHHLRAEKSPDDSSEQDAAMLSDYYSDKVVSDMVTSIMGFESVSSDTTRSSTDMQNADGFTEWAAENVPHLIGSSLSILIARRFFEDTEADWNIPAVQHIASSKQMLDMAKLWGLSLAIGDDHEYPWRLLYSTAENGTSFNRFANALFGYPGPVVLIIRDKKENLFGGVLCGEWKDDTGFYGKAGSMLFSLSPKFNMYRGHGSQQNYIFSNTRKNQYSDLPLGIGFGGEVGNFRLWIDGEFASGSARSIDSTFRKGPLLSDYEFKIRDIVVWGCGGSEADKAQVAARQKEAKEVERRRKVNRQMAAEDWGAGPDKWMMDMVGRTGGHGSEFVDEFMQYKQAKAKEAEDQAKSSAT